MTNTEFSRVLKKIIFESGIGYRKIAEECGFAHETVRMWASGKTSPRLVDAGIVLKKLGYTLEVRKYAYKD